MKKTLAVLFGGCSSEYDISLQSAAAVLRQLSSDSFLTRYDIIPLGITRSGRWLRCMQPISSLPLQLESDTWHLSPFCMPAILSPSREDENCSGLLTFCPDGSVEHTRLDLALPVLHGRNGEDGRLQGLIELAGIRLIGCGSLSSALCMDKYRAHQIAASVGISVPASVILRQADYTRRAAESGAGNSAGNGARNSARSVGGSGSEKPDSAALRTLTGELEYPLFVKPVKEGSSHGITRVTQPDQLADAVTAAFAFDDEVIIEESVDGFEIGCAVMDDGWNGLLTGRVDEIELLAEGFFDYHRKYDAADSRIHTPARIDPVTEALIAETARTIYRALDCRGFARVDMFLTPNHEIVFNEVNTIPGMTVHSRFPKMLESAGISFGGMLDRLLT